MYPHTKFGIRCSFTSYTHFLLGCPRLVRAEHGTENCGVAKIHIAFCLDHNDCLSGSKSFIYGPSTANIVRKLLFRMNGTKTITENRSLVVPVASVQDQLVD